MKNAAEVSSKLSTIIELRVVEELFLLGLSQEKIPNQTQTKNVIKIVCFIVAMSCPKITDNDLGLCEEAELEAQMFSLAQMFIRIPNVQFSTEP